MARGRDHFSVGLRQKKKNRERKREKVKRRRKYKTSFFAVQ